MHYMIRHIEARRFQVAKFEPDRNEPLAVYNTFDSDDDNRVVCSCPAYKKMCKHVKMVREFRRQGMPEGVIFDDRTGKFFEIPRADLDIYLKGDQQL